METASGDGDVLQAQSSNSRIAGCLQFWGEEWHARALVAFADKQGRTLNCAFAGLLAKAFSGGTVPDEKLRETAEQVHDIKEASFG